MIIQCEQCDARFRMADEKIKPTGTKVRCSKCKHIFKVMPPAPEPEPEETAVKPADEQPSEESVDFGSFNMEQVGGEPPSEPAAEPPPEPPAPEETTTGGDLDFSGLEEEMAGTDLSGELADDFSVADTGTPGEAETEETVSDDADTDEMTLEGSFDETESTEVDFGAAFEESTEPATEASAEFSFGETDEEPPGAGFDAPAASGDEDEGFAFGDEAEAPAAEPSTGDDGFAFEDDSTPTEETADDGSFGFGDEEDSSAFSFGDEQEEPTAEEPAASFGEGTSDEFSFGDDESDAEAGADWGSDEGSDAPGFDFEEPQFDTEAPGAEPAGDDGLQFGEISFGDDAGGGDAAPAFETDDTFGGATLAREEEPQAPPSPYEEPPPRREPQPREETPLEAPPVKKKGGPMSKVLVLLLLLLLALGGAVGYFYLEDGGLDINRIVQRFPFLQSITGELPQATPAQQIGINISGSTYVNNTKAGQLLVIQGEAINNFPKARSAITVKGILLDAQGKVLYQQTVSCGNYLNEERLQTMAFSSIEESMNNQFGDSLSNMNVASGKAIPFTIVFRNLPANIANINVEVVDSKPGDG